MNAPQPTSARSGDTAQPYLPPVPPANVSTSQLPADVHPFIGRADELRTLDNLIGQNKAPDRAQIVVVFGKAGVGKSALAIHFAHQIKARHTDAQLYANLRVSRSADGESRAATNADQAADILADFLRALGVQGEAMPASLSEKTSLYRSILVHRSVLIVLDGAESAEQTEPLIPASESSLVLVTSRSSLATLSPTRLSLDVLDMDSAIKLLAASAGGDKIDKEPLAAKEVVKRCGRLPLAIVIAGARLATRATWSVNSLAERLSTNKSNVLDEFRAGGTEIAASFSLSYQALTPAEQTLFRRLAVFRGPHFDDSAAACLIQPPRENVATMLERLADLQLLEQAAWDDCYQFHDLLREFARWHFEGDETEEKRRECYNAILEYYSQELEIADRALQPTTVGSAKSGATDPGHDERIAALKWLSRERENLVAAVALAVDKRSLSLAWHLAARLASFFEVRAHHEDWLETHQLVLRHLKESEHAEGMALLTRSLGKLYYFQHNWDQAVSRYREALQLFQERGLQREVGVTLLYLGDAYRYQREWDSARNTLTAALLLLQSVGFRRGEAIALRSLGAVSRLTGEYAKALDLYERALTIFQEIGDDRWIAATRLSIADIYIDDNRPTDARPILESCLLIFEEYGDRHWRALTLRSLGDTLRQEGKYAEAQDYLERSLVVLREDGDRHWEAATVEDLGELHAARGEWAPAIERYKECIRMLADKNRDRLVEARARKNLGSALYAQGDLAGAQYQWRLAWVSYVEQNGQEAVELLRLLRDES